MEYSFPSSTKKKFENESYEHSKMKERAPKPNAIDGRCNTINDICRIIDGRCNAINCAHTYIGHTLQRVDITMDCTLIYATPLMPPLTTSHGSGVFDMILEDIFMWRGFL